MSRDLVFTWPYALIFWAVFVWAFAPEFRIGARRHEPSATAQDANSKRLLATGQGLAMLAAFILAVTVPSAALMHARLFFWVGITAMIGGSLLRRHCWRMLGAHFTGAVIVTPNQSVVERGAYRYIRHPSYTAAMFLFAGIGLALGNWLSLGVLLFAAVVVYAYRVRVEERALVDVIGEPYRQYMLRTKRFIPFLF